MRIAVPIPCKAPFDWLPKAVLKRSSALRKSLKLTKARASGPAEVIRDVLWQGLDWLEGELDQGRNPLRPVALSAISKKPAERIAYSLVGEYMGLPARLEAAVPRLNKHESARFGNELFDLVKQVNGSADDVYCSRWVPSGSAGRTGIQLGFTIDSKRSKTLIVAFDRLMAYESSWSNASLARALLARGLKEYAPPDFEQ
jgi:hypothetical protein